MLEAEREIFFFLMLTVFEVLYIYYLILTKSYEVGVVISDLRMRRLKHKVKQLGSGRAEMNT